MEAGTIGAIIACGLLALFGASLVLLDRTGVATRAFAALLAARGVAGLANALTAEADPFLAANGAAYVTAASLLVAGLIVYFTARYPRARGFLGTPAGLAAALAPAAGALLLALLAPGIFVRWAGASPAIAPIARASVFAPYLVFPVAAFVYLARAAREGSPELRRSLGLVALAFFLDDVFAIVLTDTARGGAGFAALSPLVLVALAAGTVSLLAVAGAFVAHALRPSSPMRGLSRAGLALALVTATAAWVVNTDVLGATGSVVLRNLGRLPLALVIAYALVRHRVFGIDVTIKFTIRQSTIAAVFVGVFFIVSEIAQQLFQERTGPYFGIAAAGALVFAMAPLQRVAERVAERAMPHAHDPRSGKLTDKIDLYRQAYVLALADGILTEDEERHLAKLASVLSLDHETVFEIRRAVRAPTA